MARNKGCERVLSVMTLGHLLLCNLNADFSSSKNKMLGRGPNMVVSPIWSQRKVLALENMQRCTVTLTCRVDFG